MTILPNTATRLRRLAAFDLAVFDEVRFDRSASVTSLAVAAVSMSMLGIGGWLWWWTSGLGDSGAVFFKSAVLGTLFSLTLWLVWLLVVYAVVHRLSGAVVRVDELLRAAGLATAPLALALLMVVPAVSFGIGLIAIAGWLLATQVAIERATSVSSSHALLANMAGFSVWALGMSLLTTAGDQLAPGPFLAESLWDALAALDGAGAALLG